MGLGRKPRRKLGKGDFINSQKDRMLIKKWLKNGEYENKEDVERKNKEGVGYEDVERKASKKVADTIK